MKFIISVYYVCWELVINELCHQIALFIFLKYDTIRVEVVGTFRLIFSFVFMYAAQNISKNPCRGSKKV